MIGLSNPYKVQGMTMRGDRYRVVTLDDGHTFILQKMILEDYVKCGEEVWTDIGFYNDAQVAISAGKKMMAKEEIVWSSDNDGDYEKFVKKHQKAFKNNDYHF